MTNAARACHLLSIVVHLGELLVSVSLQVKVLVSAGGSHGQVATVPKSISVHEGESAALAHGAGLNSVLGSSGELVPVDDGDVKGRPVANLAFDLIVADGAQVLGNSRTVTLNC